MVQQQYEAHTKLRVQVAIDALGYERIQPRCANAAAAPHHRQNYSELSVDAGSDLENKVTSAPSARLSWLRIMR